jgi:hypothetical protein
VKGCCPFLPVWTDVLLTAAAHCSAKHILFQIMHTLQKSNLVPYGTGTYLSKYHIDRFKNTHKAELLLNVSKPHLLHAFPDPVLYVDQCGFTGALKIFTAST